MNDALTVRAKLEASAGPVLFSDLAAHLRRSAVFFVEARVPLADVATAIAMDDTTRVAAWLASAAVRRPTPDEEREWAASPARTWTAIVVQPFVVIADPIDA